MIETPKTCCLLFFVQVRGWDGVGVGLRYYTQFGPLRADIAIPLHKRVGGIDKAYQLYFSIGQAF